MLEAGVVGAFVAGLLSGGHCAGMCGGIAGMLSGQHRPGRWRLVLCHHLGRIGSYALIGWVAGTCGEVALFADHILPVQQALWWLAQLMLFAVGLYLADVWRGLRHIEGVGSRVWRAVSPGLPKLLPTDTPRKALLAGAVWGWLPCGLVYSLVVSALASGSGPAGALTLAAFGLGTLPNVWLIGSAGRFLVWRRPAVRRTAGLVLMLWVLWAVAQHLQKTG